MSVIATSTVSTAPDATRSRSVSTVSLPFSFAIALPVSLVCDQSIEHHATGWQRRATAPGRQSPLGRTGLRPARLRGVGPCPDVAEVWKTEGEGCAVGASDRRDGDGSCVLWFAAWWRQAWWRQAWWRQAWWRGHWSPP